jgi:ubiquitin C-terminal hydrolase
MGTLMKLRLPGCEHMDEKTASKVRKLRGNEAGRDFVQYICVDCPFEGGFSRLDAHYSKTQHGFATSSRSTYCAACQDLVYDPDFVRKGTKKGNLVQANEEEDATVAANTSQRPCGREGVRGLFNLGETCYMNAVIQMMVHNPLLASFFLGMGHPVHLCPISNAADKKADSDSEDDDDEEKDPKACVACGMTEVFSDAVQADLSQPAHAVNLLFASWKNIPHMQGKHQQDAQEWFMLIVDKLHESLSANPDSRLQCECFFHKVFFGRLHQEVTCDKCKTVSVKEEEYSSIGLDFKKQFRRKVSRRRAADQHQCTRLTPLPEESSARRQDSCSHCTRMPPQLYRPRSTFRRTLQMRQMRCAADSIKAGPHRSAANNSLHPRQAVRHENCWIFPGPGEI